MYIMITFLEINGITINATNNDVIQAGLNLACGSMNYNNLLNWINEHKSN